MEFPIFPQISDQHVANSVKLSVSATQGLSTTPMAIPKPGNEILTSFSPALWNQMGQKRREIMTRALLRTCCSFIILPIMGTIYKEVLFVAVFTSEICGI